MNKSKNFSGQPIIKQVLSFIDAKDIYRLAKKHHSDRDTKKFTTYGHLAMMMFAVASGCSSLSATTMNWKTTRSRTSTITAGR